eukprot:PITA_02078
MASLTNLMLEGSQRFNGTNYNIWRQRMLTIFEYRRLDQLVLNKELRPGTAGTDQDKFDDRNREAVMLLKLSVADDQLPQIPSGKTAAEIWQQLKDLHETSDKSRAFFLKNQLFSIMMDKHISLQEHLNKIKDIRDQLEAIGRTMEEEDLVVITLKSLPPSYEHFIETLNITATNVDLKFPDLCTKLMQQDRWKQQFGSGAALASSENAFAAKYQSYQQKGSAQSFDPARKKTVQCNYCHKFGHMKKDCRQKIASEQKKQGGIHQTANVAEHSEQTDSAFYAFMAKRSSDHIPSSVWYIDSGASRHFSHRREWFIDFSPFSDSVVFGGGEKYTVDGRGTVQIQSGGRTLTFLNVYYVPGMETNLLSVSQIMRNSPQLDIVFSLHKCSIIDREKNLIVVVGLEDHGLYRLLDTGDFPELALAARASLINTLWHQRYGHLNMQYLSQLSREGLVTGLPDIQTQQLGICGACQVGKQHRSSFTNGESWRASKVLQLIHVDICGPMKTSSITACKYFLLIVDDFSRNMWVYFLKNKSDAFSIFQKFKILVEKESSCDIMTLRTDNGGEFCSSAFSTFCATHGIKRQFTTPYTPKQNSVVERRNRTVVEMARSMLQHKNIPNKFWAEAIFTVVYLLNRSPTQAVKGKTPEEVWSGRKPKISHLKVFGSIAYTWIPAAKRSKLDSKSQKLMMTRGFFQSSSSEQYSTDQPHSVLLPVGPPDGRDDAVSMFDNTLREHPPENNSSLAAPIAPDPSSSTTNVSSSTLRPKWWAKTIGDLRDDELLEGRTSRHKSTQQSIVNFALMANIHSTFEPQSYSEAKGTPEWEQAMDAEFQSLQENHTWTLSDLPARKKPISCKWIYKVKYKANGTLDKYKARLVARGFSQKEGIDYEETFAPTAKMSTIRLVLALTAQFKWKVHQMDVKSAFLNGDLQEEVYMTQPPGFKIADHGFQRSPSDANLYIKNTDDDILFVVVYVDDLIITGSSAHWIHEIKQDLCRTFDMTDLGLLHYCLGIEVWQTENNIFLSQSKYAKNLVDRFRMQDCKPATTPMEPGLKLSAQSSSPPVDETLFRQLVGSLIYLTATRPDISFSVSYISRFMSAPKADHWIATKRVLRYVRGNSDYGLLYTRSSDPMLSGYTDSDWAGSVDDRKSTAGYVFNLGSGAVTWTSKKQQAVALSSTEAEYRGAVKASCEAVWLRRMLADMHASQTGPTSLFCDNQGVLKLAKNPVFHERTKHVETHCHYIRQLVETDSFG